MTKIVKRMLLTNVQHHAYLVRFQLKQRKAQL